LDPFAIFTLRGGGWSAPCPGTSPPAKMQYPLYRNLDGPQGWSGQAQKNITPTDSNPGLTSVHMVMYYEIKACSSVKIIPCINFGTRCVYMLRHVLTSLLKGWRQIVLQIHLWCHGKENTSPTPMPKIDFSLCRPKLNISLTYQSS